MRRSASCASTADDLRHLHERQHAFLHARAARRRDDDERILALERPLAEARDLLADDRAHRAAHEREVHHAERSPAATSSVPVHASSASVSPAFAVAFLRRAGYSGNPSGSVDRRSTSTSSIDPSSSSRRNSRTPECGDDSRSSGRRSCCARTFHGCPCVRTPRTSPRRRRESRDAHAGAAGAFCLSCSPGHGGNLGVTESLRG